MKIEINSRDLQFKTLDDGRKVVQLKGATAFDEDFQRECEEAGVKEYVNRGEEEENE
jgi:hypothetical protein